VSSGEETEKETGFGVQELNVIMGTQSFSDQPPWLFSRRADFWLASGGASLGLLAAVVIIFWHGDRELDGLDFVLSELHLGATYGAIVRRRLWRHRQVDVLVVPLVILALTYAFSISGQTMLLTSIAMYAAVWHRGRQTLGLARFYQRVVGGPVSQRHNCLFRGAIYLPMVAATFAYTNLAPMEYEGEPYLALNFGAEMTSVIGMVTTIWVIAYLGWMLRQSRCQHLDSANGRPALAIHPGEWWVVLAHAVAFGSAYVLGASNASFLLVLAVHHEVQYLYFTYAMARHAARFDAVSEARTIAATKDLHAKVSNQDGRALRIQAGHAASFLVWPVIGLAGAIAGGWFELEWLAPMGIGGLFCHYWLDGRIWTRRSFAN
jgi:hypothetical protein